MNNNPMREHWDRVYASKDINRLGWYEETPAQCVSLLSKCRIDKDAPILDVGAGASTLIDYLLEREYKNIIAVDISEIALNKLKERLGEEKTRSVKWIVDDVTQPTRIQNLKDIVLWHDRALLHFLLEDAHRLMYLNTLERVVKKGGYVIIACFSLKGAKKCSGLNIKNHDQNMLAKFLGVDFDLLEYFDYTYYTPSGEPRPYIYTLFQRKN
ncbi:MAG: class I SAM-dependent methyltransferase [Thermodesulfobacteriota bacterium]